MLHTGLLARLLHCHLRSHKLPVCSSEVACNVHALLQGGRRGGPRGGRDNGIELVSYCVCHTTVVVQEA